VLCSLLWLGAAVIALGNGLDGSGWRNPEAATWTVMLLAQSLPYLAGLVTSLVSAMPSLASAVRSSCPCPHHRRLPRRRPSPCRRRSPHAGAGDGRAGRHRVRAITS